MASQGTNGRKTSTAVAVLEVVADETGVDMLDIETPLAKVIDPDHLDALWRSTDRNGHDPNGAVAFNYHGCRVTVKSDGTVSAKQL